MVDLGPISSITVAMGWLTFLEKPVKCELIANKLTFGNQHYLQDFQYHNNFPFDKIYGIKFPVYVVNVRVLVDDQTLEFKASTTYVKFEQPLSYKFKVIFDIDINKHPTLKKLLPETFEAQPLANPVIVGGFDYINTETRKDFNITYIDTFIIKF